MRRRFAVLLAIAAVVFSVSQASAGVCDIWAYVTDPDPNGLNIRGGPGTGNRIVGVIARDPAESLVHIVEMKNGWGRIDKAEGHESGKSFNTKGWVSLRMVAIATRGYDGNGVPAWAAPGSAAKSAGRFPSESEVELMNCRGDWPLVRDKSGREAWLRPEDACATALTYCN